MRAMLGPGSDGMPFADWSRSLARVRLRDQSGSDAPVRRAALLACVQRLMPRFSTINQTRTRRAVLAEASAAGAAVARVSEGEVLCHFRGSVASPTTLRRPPRPSHPQAP